MQHSYPLFSEAQFVSYSGTGQGIVLKRADDSVMGRIAALTVGIDSVTSPIAVEIHHIIVVLAGVVLFFTLECFGQGYVVILTSAVFRCGYWSQEFTAVFFDKQSNTSTTYEFCSK